MTVWICSTCGVEHPDTEVPPAACAICSDDRQWVPAGGQSWTTRAELAAEGVRTSVAELEPGLFGLATEPGVGIGQRGLLLRTEAGNLLWEPPGFLDREAIDAVRDLGGVALISMSHPHMWGTAVSWAHEFAAPILVAEADRKWIRRPDPAIGFWSGTREVLPGVTFVQCGGHFAGSSVTHFTGGDGRGVLLAGDTIAPNPDRRSVTFMRSFPNRIPLSPRAVRGIVDAVSPYVFERLYGNFRAMVPDGAREMVLGSADRYIAWITDEAVDQDLE